VVARLPLPPRADAPEEPSELGVQLEHVYRTHFALVWRGLRRLGVPDASLDDAAQDVFLVVHRRGSEFEGRASLRTWLYGIVVRVAKDYRRSLARHERRVEHFAERLRTESHSSASPADEAERREANELLHTLLASLTDEQRDVLVLAVLEQLPVKEAAQALGLHVRACQRRLRAANLAFEQALARYLANDARSG